MSEGKSTNITFHQGNVSSEERAGLVGQKGFTIWFTGLSASGKSTIACALEQALLHQGHIAYRLDGDNIRFGLNSNLGFTEQDRTENIRRISEVCKLFADACVIAVSSFISPFVEDRNKARKLHEAAGLAFIEVYADAPLDVVKERDPKGLYKKALAGEIKDFTGVSSPYEAPVNPEVHLKTGEVSVDGCVQVILEYLTAKGLLKSKN